MTDDTDPRILELAGYGDDLLRASILLAEEFANFKNKTQLDRLSNFTGRKAGRLAKIPTTFKTEWERGLDNFEMLTCYELLRLPAHDRAVLAKRWRDATLSWGQVRELVDAKLKKQRKPREPKANLAAKLQAFIVELEKETTCGAPSEMVCQRKMIADQLRALLCVAVAPTN